MAVTVALIVGVLFALHGIDRFESWYRLRFGIACNGCRGEGYIQHGDNQRRCPLCGGKGWVG